MIPFALYWILCFVSVSAYGMCQGAMCPFGAALIIATFFTGCAAFLARTRG